jgi:hypothetical protein
MRYYIVQGRNQYNSAALAYGEDFASFSLTGFPAIEGVALYQITWVTGRPNTVKGRCRYVSTQRISANVVSTSIAATASHNSLTGLQGGTTNEYYHLTNAEYTTLQSPDEFTMGVVIDGAGFPFPTGSKGYIAVVFDCEITSWTILADTSGDCVIDVKKCDYAGFPTTASIAGTEKPTLSVQDKNQDLSLDTWTTSLSAGDILEFVVDSVDTVTKVWLTLTAIKV